MEERKASIRIVSSYFAILKILPYIKISKIKINLVLTYLKLRYIILIEKDYKEVTDWKKDY